MWNRFLLTGASCLTFATSVPTAAQTAAAFPSGHHEPTPRGTRSSDETSAGDIIVTASRRSESLREVPTAVTAISGKELQESQLKTVVDLAAVTPNVQISILTTNINIAIRGVGNGGFTSAGGEPGVALSADGIYLGRSTLAVQTFLDVQRVEVLRGPQGTLFGRNATGGAINILPNTPTDTLKFGAEATAGVDPTAFRSSGYVSGPLNGSNTLLVRMSLEQNYNRGFTRNASPDGPNQLDGINDYAGRAQLEWRPTTTFSARLSAEYAHDKDNGAAGYLFGTPSGALPVFPFLGLFPVITPTAADFGNPQARVARNNVGLRDANAETYSLHTNWRLGGGTLSAVYSYNRSFGHTSFDVDGTSIPYLQSDFIVKARQHFAETVYSSDPSKRLTFVLGANYYREDLSQEGPVTLLNFAPGIIINSGGVVRTKSSAGFGHLDFKILPSTRIFAGLRYTHDKKDLSEFSNFPAAKTRADERSWSRVTYEFGVSSDLSSTVTAYAKYSTGYKSGGYSAGGFLPAFDPETNGSMEVGLKGSALDRAVQFNLAAFHMRYNNLQVTQITDFASAVTNAAKATVNGVELEGVLRPTGGLRIQLTGAWLDARFDRYSTADSSRPAGPGCTVAAGSTKCIFDLAGNRLANAPKWSGTLGLYYELPVSRGTLTPGARFDWKSRSYFSEFNLPVLSAATNGRLNLYLTYKSGDGRWSGSVFALNVTDQVVKTNATTVSNLLGSLISGKYAPGRQIGASLGYNF